MLKIDSHTHLIPKHLPKWSKIFNYDGFIFLDHHKSNSARMMQGDTFFREVGENTWDAEIRIEEYASKGVQVQVVSTIPVLFAYWAKPKDTLEVAKFLNDDMANLVSKFPKNYIGLGTLPMQEPSLAVEELRRCKEIGLKGVQIGSNINTINLEDERFHELYAALEELDMAVLVHPWEMMGQENMKRYWLPWLVGMPAETARAIASLLFGGIFEKFPKIRFNFAHAGGSFLFTLGRLTHGFNCRPDLVAVDNPYPPSHYLGHFWVDSITHDEVALNHVINTIGSKKITLGSDYPFPLGDLELGKFIDDMNCDKKIKEDIFHQSTLDWLNLSKEDFI